MIHTFRHFVASALIHGGLDVTTVSRTLGHSKPTTTLNI
ncbi:MAG: tyrosine-type recombinase/integrase [Clostridia bacterium]|nr:tyrosine-type recombinase/integrase [Clostridia bacterium]